MKKLFSLHRVLLGILLVAAGVAAQAEDYQPPSEKERQAVKALSEAGASITLNANYQVSGVGFSFTASPTDRCWLIWPSFPMWNRFRYTPDG